MIEQIYQFFTFEMIYLWLNIGVLPFWFILIFFSQSNIGRYLVTSIFPYLILGSIYIYLLFLFYRADYNFIDNFKLYLGMDSLKELLNEDSFLIAFWLHFIAINLFCGSWIVKDSHKYFMPIVLYLTSLVQPSHRFQLGRTRVLCYRLVKIYKQINKPEKDDQL